MKKIFKYPFKIEKGFLLEMPYASIILSVQNQQETPCIWALVDPNQPLVEYDFKLFATGEPIEYHEDIQEYNYVGTFQLLNGALVYHLFCNFFFVR